MGGIRESGDGWARRFKEIGWRRSNDGLGKADGHGMPQRQWTPISRALELIGDRWTLLILAELLGGPLRIKHLHERIPAISKQELAAHLRQMVANGLVERQQRELRPRIDYSLSESGRELLGVLASMSHWGMRRAWSVPRPDEHTHVLMLIRQLPLLLEAEHLPSGVVELVVEGSDSAERHMVNLDKGNVTLVDDLSSAMPWARIVGSEVAWIQAFGPRRFVNQLHISGDHVLAKAVLDALPACA